MTYQMAAGTTGNTVAAHKVVDLLSGLLVLEAHAIVSPHDAIACPLAHSSAQIGLVALAHGTLGAEGLHACNILSLAAWCYHFGAKRPNRDTFKLTLPSRIRHLLLRAGWYCCFSHGAT